MKNSKNYILLLTFLFGCLLTMGQDKEGALASGINLLHERNFEEATLALGDYLAENPNDELAKTAMANTLTWTGKFDEARSSFNKITSKNKKNRSVWIAAIKNELYAKEYAIAYGIALKARRFLPEDRELQRLENLALNRLKAIQKARPKKKTIAINKSKSLKQVAKKDPQRNLEASRENALGISNNVTVFDQRYDPMFSSTISYKHKFKFGAVIPKITYSKRFGIDGVKYGVDAYPKFFKKTYTFLSYAHSKAVTYPKHTVAGDFYVNAIPKIEFSFGARYIETRTNKITTYGNSIGTYRGNYYLTYRSYVTPRNGNLLRYSGSLLVRKYLKTAENYIGFSGGFGFSPEFRQFFSDDTLFAETITYIESQRLNVSYQFTNKTASNIYRINIGVRRQEIASQPGSFFYAANAGISYRVKM